MAYPQQLTGYNAPYVWSLDGVYAAHAVSAVGALDAQATAVVGGAAGAGIFGGFRECPIGCMLDSNLSPVPQVSFTIRRRVPGAAGATTVEFYRLRAAVWTLLATLTMPFGTAAGAAITGNVASLALATINSGDVLIPILTAVETVTVADLTATATFG